MRRRFLSAFFFWLTSLLLFQNPLHGTHIMGVDISYECTGPCTYRIYHRTYFDCTGSFMVPGYVPVSSSPAPTIPNITITGLGNCVNPTVGGWTLQSYEEVTPLCPDFFNPPPGVPYPTGCEGNPGLNPNPPINGVAEAIYYTDVNFCNANCDIYTISWSDCCRNNVIDSGAANQGIYSSETEIDLSVSPCNSSPSFIDPVTGNSRPPIAYICAGQTSTFNQGAYDPDGDSLSYELGPCFSGAGAPVTYNLGYSPTTPMGPTWNVSIDPQTGDLTFSPNPTGSEVVGVICIIVTEWRNGQVIGQVKRDMQVTVINNCASTNPVTGGVQDLALGVDQVPAYPLSFNEVRVCAGVEFCFEIPVISQDTALEYTMWWDQSINGATFTDAADTTVTDTVVGAEPVAQFCWTPPPGSYGTHYFVLTVRDDACPVPGLNQYTLVVYVDEVLINADAVGVPIGCNEVELSIVPNSTIPSDFSSIFPITQWSGNGNLNLNPSTSDSSLTHLYPSPGVYSYQVYLEDTFGCSITLPGIVDLQTGVTADAGPDITICSNYEFTLGTPAVAGQYYNWGPGTNLDDSTLAQPTFTYDASSGPPNQTVFNYVLEVTDSICTTYDYTSVVVNPSLQADIIAPDTVICAGDSATLIALGTLSANYTYLWSTGDTTQSITVAPNTTTTYSVILFSNGCSSLPEQQTIEVQSGPSAQISGDFRMCPGEGTSLTASGGQDYLWSAGGFTGPNITLNSIFADSTVFVVAIDAQGCPGTPTAVTLRPYPLPAPSFVSDTVCEGSSTHFQNLTSIATGTINGYQWDFGDGSAPVPGFSPVHTFEIPGTYDVQLIATSNRGCQDSVTIPVRVEATPEADFTFTNECEGLANQFVDNSTIEPVGNIANYLWDFGDDGGTGAGQTVTHVYDTFGFYNVTLTVQSAAGCSDSYTRTAFVHPNPVADFEVISACEDSVVLASSSSAVGGGLDFINDYYWNFGDPTSSTNTSTRQNPTHIYPEPAVYTIVHRITTANGCVDSVTRDVTVYPSPVADFSYDQTCENESTRFFDQSQAAPATPLTYWAWDLGVNKPVRESQNTSYRYFSDGDSTYSVMLAVRTSEGCVDTVYKDVVINPQPRTDFNASVACLFDSTTFSDQTRLASGELTSWLYDFGDGRVSTQPNPQYTYGASGFYTVTLTTVSDSGCTNSRTKQVEVRALPEIADIRNDSTCFGDQATLLAIADPSVRLDWLYSLDDAEPFHTGNVYTTPPLPFETTYFVRPVSNDRYGCVNTPQPITAFVYEDETLELFSSAEIVEMPLAIIEFGTGSTVPLTEWRWNFGDGNTSNSPTPAHEYAVPGRYKVTATVTDVNGCVTTLDKVVEVKEVTTVAMPTAFSPNGDGINDFFRAGLYNMQDFNIQVFNRWGRKIYESDDPNFAWDGTTLDGKPVREGVYVYVVNAIDFRGTQYTESRTLTVIK
ncbi:MAG: PKD domain-containing protein [Bacteroidetes bacterium]|nr:MAG: PKD domain-containing protein [Bacteroidota bacterium]